MPTPMNGLHKILVTVLILSLCFAPVSFAADALFHQEPTGAFVPVVSVTEANSQPEDILNDAFEAVPSADEFLAEAQDESPLSPADSEIEIDSNDPFFDSTGSWGQSYADLWWLKAVKAPEAWSFSKGAGVTVAVIDTGLDFNHLDIAQNAWYNQAELNGLAGFDDDGNGFIDDIKGWDFHNGDNDPQDDHGHGTHVAGIIGAVSDNLEGIAGVAPLAKILSVKVLSASGSGFVENVINGIYYAANLGAQVINMSLGALKSALPKSLRSAFESAVKYARSKGSVVAVAAGNSNANVSNYYPAGISSAITVGAVEPVTYNRAWFSNFGSGLDLVAPGVDVLSLRSGGTSFGSSSVVDPDYSRASGTSMATPIVAGLAALLKSQDPTLTPDGVFQRMKYSATDLGSRGFDIYYGYGLVNAYKAVTSTYYSNGRLKSEWVPDEESSGFILHSYDSKGRLISNFPDPEFEWDSPRFVPSVNLPMGNWYAVWKAEISQNDISKRRKKAR